MAEPTTGEDIPANQREAITKLGEEAGEYIQAMCKTLNFGYVAECEGRTWLNLMKLQAEMADMLAAIELCVQNDVINRSALNVLARAKLARMNERLNYATVTSDWTQLTSIGKTQGD